MMSTPIPKTSAPARRALDNAGIASLEDLSKHTEKEIANLHGMGPKAIRMLKEAMKEKGFAFVK
jgi:DNA-directed RNA polymerase alpha subunit